MRSLFIPLLLSAFFSCRAQQQNELNANEFAKALGGKNIQVLDVRTPGEFNGGHIENALLADWNNQPEFNRRVQHIDKDKPVYVYCLAGGRSASAAQWMRQHGFQQVYELKGGIHAWRAAGKPLQATAALPQMSLQQFMTLIPADTVCLVDVGAKWCPPCVKLEPVLQEIEREMAGKVKLLRIDAATQTQIMQELGIAGLPGLLVYKNGKQTWKQEGMATKEEILKQLQ
jgi:rhodanese-related sulfurtransferase